MTIKQRIGKYIFQNMPISKHVFDHFRLELNAWVVRLMHRVHPFYLLKIKSLKSRKNLLVNIGCGPYGLEQGWINLDLYPVKNVYLRTDCRRKLPFSSDSCLGIHVEMFLEHLDPEDELPFFLSSCYQVLQRDGILRIVVPDAQKFINAYISGDWKEMNKISYGLEDWVNIFPTKMDALNHVFLQGYEHYGGWDKERLFYVLFKAGFSTIKFVEFGMGDFPSGPIDREYHRQNGLYVEAQK